MEETEVLIIGQGLAGTWLSYWLHMAGIRFKIIDKPNTEGASLRAAGLINPVTGRRMVTTWLIEELMPFASESYSAMGRFLKQKLIEKTSVIDFFPSVQMLQSFRRRVEEDPVYLNNGDDREKYTSWFKYDLGWGAISPCWLINVERLLSGWRAWLKNNDLLNEAVFDISGLQVNGKGITYSDIHARHIIFCDGVASAGNPYFENLPFALNKGEGLLVEIMGLPANLVFKKGMNLVPYRDNIYWLGSSYEWSFSDGLPTAQFRQQSEIWLQNFLRLPFTILEHFAAVRPATLERRPFVGFHPLHPQIGILNGLGTKGCSLAPYFASQLADKIAETGTIHPLADITRFDKILARPR